MIGSRTSLGSSSANSESPIDKYRSVLSTEAEGEKSKLTKHCESISF